MPVTAARWEPRPVIRAGLRACSGVGFGVPGPLGAQCGQGHVAQHRPGRGGGGPVGAVRGRVDEPEGGMRHGPCVGLSQGGVEAAQGAHPQFDVAPLGLAHLPAGVRREGLQLPVLHPDQVRFPEREVEVEVHQAVERAPGIVGVVDHVGAAGQQATADVDQQLDEQRVLVGEVPVDGGAADAHRCPEVLESYAVEPALGDEARGGLEQLPSPVGLGPAACGEQLFVGVRLQLGHRPHRSFLTGSGQLS
ncbi:hypothetical protein RHRU231_450311 [Rhodococcus ruber]|uniref:Uncharacterized protein n=1 Tax=Rhodococcus ruber TaxID=1830 RepID=A0A098BK55_9NOCA|nr:hypothetical protein RHRU231_450311 [Rhodococcus ruber]